MKKKKEKPLPPTKFTVALQGIYYDNGWVFPPMHTIAVYDERIRQLEAEIERLTGGRSNKAKRIDPLGKKIPS